MATEACRRASNCDSFIERVALETGIELDIITAEEEARMALAGCAPLLDPERPSALVFDIGGGSTELMWVRTGGSGMRLTDQTSVPHGVVTLTEQFGGEPGRRGDLRRDDGRRHARVRPRFEARNHIISHVARHEVQVLGTSGTVTTLAGINLGLQSYDRSLVDGTWLDLACVRRISAALRVQDYSARAAHPRASDPTGRIS